MATTGDSILQYGGVSLPFVKTEKFIQEPQYSPDGVDYIYTRVTIGVGCVLNDCTLGQSVADWYRSVRPILMQRGLPLYYIVDGQYVLPSDDNPLDTAGDEAITSPNYDYQGGSVWDNAWGSDAKLGPKPKRFEIKEIQGGTWIAYYEIETYIPYCEGEPSVFLSNRWESSVDVDEHYFLQRIINGTLVLNGQFETTANDFSSGYGIQLMVANNIIIPPVPKRWKREAIKISRSQDSLIVNYTIVDKQQYSAMPRPATKIDATYTETSGTKDLALMNLLLCECQVLIHGEVNENYDPTSGDPDQNKYDIMKLMFQIVFSRIKFPFSIATSADSFSENEFITYFQMKEEMFKPIVGCTVRCTRSRSLTTHPIGKNTDWQSNVWALTNVGDPIEIGDIQNDIARQPENLGNYGLFLLSANALKLNLVTGSTTFSPLTPCDDESYRSINFGSGYTIYQGNTTVYTTLLTTGASDLATGSYDVRTGTYYGGESYNHPFTEYSIDVNYVTDRHVMQLPLMYDVDENDDDSAVFATTAAPTTRKIITYQAGRLGRWPMAPDPSEIEVSTAVSGDKVLSHTITMKNAELMDDGITRKYQIGGIYEIGMAKRLQYDVADTTINVAVSPKTNDIWGSSFNTYPTSGFVSGIISYSNQAPGGDQP